MSPLEIFPPMKIEDNPQEYLEISVLPQPLPTRLQPRYKSISLSSGGGS